MRRQSIFICLATADRGLSAYIEDSSTGYNIQYFILYPLSAGVRGDGEKTVHCTVYDGCPNNLKAKPHEVRF